MSLITCPTLHCDLVPDCELEFRLSTQYTGTVKDGAAPVELATMNNALTLCKDTVVFKNIECAKRLKSVILGIPLKFVKGCHVYTIDLPSIPDNTDNNIIVTHVETQTQLTLEQFQVANGYLYVEICLTDTNNQTLIDFEGEDAPSIELCFDKFTFGLTKKFVPCNCAIGCKPVVWNYGQEIQPVSPP